MTVDLDLDSETLTRIEKSLIRGTWDTSISSENELAGLAKSVIEGDYARVLTSPLSQLLFTSSQSDSSVPINQLFPIPPTHPLLRLLCAISCLHAFVQSNWTGPDLTFSPSDILHTPLPLSELNQKAIAELAYGGEPAYHLAKHPILLRLAQILFDGVELETAGWWRLRWTNVHMQVLDEAAPPPPSILDFEVDYAEPDLVARLSLEKGLLQHRVGQDKLAGELSVSAARATGLEYELTGALGKRTKFQERETSQLVLLAVSKLSLSSTETETPSNSQIETTPNAVPETLALNDDTLLEKTQFTSSSPSPSSQKSHHLSHIDPKSQPVLHPLDQSTLLALCLNVRNTSPTHGLTTEQMSPYITRVLENPVNWSVHTIALLLRSRLESSRTRTVERSALQLQALIDQMPTSDSSVEERLRYFHCLPLPSKWEMEKELANRLASLGVIKSALEIYEKLEMWEDVVKCYGSLEKPEKGISIVQDLLSGEKAEAEEVLARGKDVSEVWKTRRDGAREAKLWCLLGDLQPSEASSHYEKAWDVSNHTSGRAMRSLGGYHFARAQYPQAIKCLKEAVRINPLLTRSWFILGCACMRVEDWVGGRDAFARCVALDDEDGESWNNLASMYLRLGAKPSNSPSSSSSSEEMTYNAETSASIPFSNKMLAFRALKQGLRYSYDNWRMWYNYMIVSMDVGELQECTRALSRVVEETADKLGRESVDEDVLERLVNAVTRVPADEEKAKEEAGEGGVSPNEGHGLYRNVLGLFERTLLPRVSSPRIFRAYARLQTWKGNYESGVESYLNAYRLSIAGIDKETDVEKFKEAVREVEEIVDVLRNFGSRVEGMKWRAKAGSLIRSFLGRTREFEGEEGWGVVKELGEEVKREED